MLHSHSFQWRCRLPASPGKTIPRTKTQIVLDCVSCHAHKNLRRGPYSTEPVYATLPSHLFCGQFVGNNFKAMHGRAVL